MVLNVLLGLVGRTQKSIRGQVHNGHIPDGVSDTTPESNNLQEKLCTGKFTQTRTTALSLKQACELSIFSIKITNKQVWNKSIVTLKRKNSTNRTYVFLIKKSSQ